MSTSERDTRAPEIGVDQDPGPRVEGVAQQVDTILQMALGGPVPLRLRGWDGSEAGDAHGDATLVLRNPDALRRLLWSPNELGLVRAYVSGDLDFEGDIFAALDLPDVIERVAHHEHIGLSTRERLAAARIALRLGAVGLPPAPPPEEVRRHRGRLHSRSRDAQSVSHHYDVGNDFYRLVLGPSMVYSCAYWTQPARDGYTLDDAQDDKLDLVIAKLGLRPGMRLLDVGCGWGSLAIRAAQQRGVHVVGVTVSKEQAALARRRVHEAGLDDLVEIRLQDYRDVSDGPYDAISSVGMSEHVGRSQLVAYARTLVDQLAPGGRLLNHAIASVRTLPPATKSEPGFIDSYIFPDGCGSTTAAPCAPGSTTCSRAGRRRSTSWARHVRGRGSSTSPHAPSRSSTATSPSTRCSPSARRTTVSAACRRRARSGSPSEVPRVTAPVPGSAPYDQGFGQQLVDRVPRSAQAGVCSWVATWVRKASTRACVRTAASSAVARVRATSWSASIPAP